MKDLSDKKTFNINKLNKNLLEEYIKSYDYTIQNNNSEILDQNEKILVYVLTFNIQGGMPSEKEIPLLFPKKEKIEKFDIFVINTQECLRSIGASFFIDSKETWIEALTSFLGEKYMNLINSNLGALHISIFIKKEKATYFSELRSGDIKTGFLNIMANKGAVSTSMKYYDKHILFVCCHLAAGQEKEFERNEDLIRIRNKLQNSIDHESKSKLRIIKQNLKSEMKKEKLLLSRTKTLHFTNSSPDKNNINKNKKRTRNSVVNLRLKDYLSDEIDNKSEEGKSSRKKDLDQNEEKQNLNATNNNNNKEKDEVDDRNDILKEKVNLSISSASSGENANDKKDKIFDEHDIVILSGDLNYRLNIKSEEIEDIINKNNPEILWDKDQLTEEIKSNHNFKEGIITFMPTYKFKKTSNEYDYSRIPGWTDRILYRSKRQHDIMLCEYSSINDVLISDHKPVFAVFKINCKDTKIINDNFHKSEQECCII